MHPGEIALVDRALQQDAVAYGELVRRYEKAIYHHCFSIVHDEDAAEDIAQESFISAYYKLSTFDRSRKFSTWLFKIATNNALNYLRAGKRVQPLDDLQAEKLVSPHSSPHQSSEDAELHAAVEKLKPRYQAVISLYYWQGKSYAEIAEIMGKPEGSVKGWINRAKAQLRKELS